MTGPILIRVPDHLGDGVMALPAVTALARLAPSWVVGPKWAEVLYRDCGLTRDRGASPAMAVLLKPSFSAAWAVRRVPRRIGLSWDARWPLLSHAVVSRQGHRLDDYAAITQAAGARSAGLPSFPTSIAERRAIKALPDRAVLLLPGSASGAVVRWGGFQQLARGLAAAGLSPVFAGGPAEEGYLHTLAGDFPCLETLDLVGFAAVAVSAVAVVGNDSGLSHLAAAARRAAGRRVDAVHVVFGSTDPARTGDREVHAHRQTAPLACWPCYRKRCSFGTPCLDLGVEPVLAAVIATAQQAG